MRSLFDFASTPVIKAKSNDVGQAERGGELYHYLWEQHPIPILVCINKRSLMHLLIDGNREIYAGPCPSLNRSSQEENRAITVSVKHGSRPCLDTIFNLTERIGRSTAFSKNGELDLCRPIIPRSDVVADTRSSSALCHHQNICST